MFQENKEILYKKTYSFLLSKPVKIRNPSFFSKYQYVDVYVYILSIYVIL